ncbi:hypothetical protein ABBQ32_012089 [Trebouxia sp. C0010 RCD-2024]
MHPQTAAWLKDLDFTDSEEDTQSLHTARAEEDAVCDSSSSFRRLILPSLPAEVLFTVIDLLDLPALASFAQTCRDVRAICLLDSVWDRLCDSKGSQQGPHPHKYHKPKPSHSTSSRQTAPYASNTDTVPVQQDAATFVSAEQHPTSTHTHSQVRYSYFDNNLRLQYSSGLVVEPAWLTLLPKVSSQGSNWLYVKAKTVSESTLKVCSSSFRHTNHHVRREVHMLWLQGEVKDTFLLQRTLLKLTRLSWSKTYETLSNAFVYASDCTALDLKTDHLQGVPWDISQAACIWQSVLTAWQEYRTWLTKVCSLCNRLVECISAERAAELMSRGKADTPTLFDMGKAAFRSQVILAYGLRSALQASWEALQSSARRNCQSVDDAHVLLDTTRLLQELDVADDGTKPAGYHTQERMREVFGLGEYRHEHARNLLQLELCREATNGSRRQQARESLSSYC